MFVGRRRGGRRALRVMAGLLSAMSMASGARVNQGPAAVATCDQTGPVTTTFVGSYTWHGECSRTNGA